MTSTAYSKDQALDYDRSRFGSSSGLQIHLEEMSRLTNVVPQVTPGGRVLEVGCGTGRFSEHMVRSGFDLVAVDASESMLGELRLKDFASEMELGVAEAADLPFETDEFEFCYAIRLLNQTESPAYALSSISEMNRVTKSGGLVLVEYLSGDRPRLFGQQRSSTTLKKQEVVDLIEHLGGEVLKFDGAFLFGMTSRRYLPAKLRRFLPAIESWFPSTTHRFYSRCYLLFKASDGQ